MRLNFDLNKRLRTCHSLPKMGTGKRFSKRIWELYHLTFIETNKRQVQNNHFQVS